MIRYYIATTPSNFIAGRPKAALLVRSFMIVLLSICLCDASIVATYILPTLLSVMLYNKKNQKILSKNRYLVFLNDFFLFCSASL